ncbi:hypothetical protein A6A06_20235 [Streptomyces sp. CB02923]|uniref:hypothetical protein n=1 Tax=Streptomyces sp. CB02923 TaxID=1718985 RepID=UPI00093FD38F|nr:hypothetical protein [Streptomyces sp. CB02923]OKI01160.1 hypothetical protein A6A06_20235 [Streptomyces sp. CB02923]
MPVEEFPIQQTGGSLVPHSVAVDPQGWLSVTTDNSALVQISRRDPTAQTVHRDALPEFAAGILKDPTGRKVVWLASPTGPQDSDPIHEFDVEARRVINKHGLQDGTRAQAITGVRVKTGSGPSDASKGYVVFAEPTHTSVGYVEVGKDGANHHPLPTGTDEFDTWLWSVAATLDTTRTKCTYWATGQKHDEPERKTNGLYTYTPADDDTWQRIPLPNGAEQVPIHVIAGVLREDERRDPYLWISARNPHQILRYDIRNKSWASSPTLTGEPRQLAFGPDGNIWVAGTDQIHCFEKDAALRSLPVPALPSGSEAHGICVDPSDQVLWYTNRKTNTIGKYPLPDGSRATTGKTQVLAQPQKETCPGAVAEVPMVAEFVALGEPTPEIPLTCRIISEEATFTDGSRERVIATDPVGQVAFPAVLAGKVEEDVFLKMSWGDNEPSTTVILRVRNDEE